MVREHILARAREERFHLVARSVPSQIKMETDLFEGVEENKEQPHSNLRKPEWGAS